MPTLHRRSFLGLAATAWAVMAPGRANAAPTGATEVNVKEYGATGASTSDDTAAIHAARDAAGVGGKIIIPSGAYLVSGLTADVANQTWELSDDAVILMKAGAKKVLSIAAAGVSVVGGIFDCSNVTEHDGSSSGIEINSDDIAIRNATVRNSPFYGIAAYNHNQVTIAGCTVVNSYYAGIWVQNSLAEPSNLYDVSITDNTVDNSSGSQQASGIGVYGNSHNQRVNRVLITRNIIKLPYRQASDVTGCIGPLNCTDLTVTDNSCSGGYISISCSNTLRGTISNNTVRGFGYVGVELPVDPPGEMNNVSVTENLLDPDGESAAAGIQTSSSVPSASGSISNLNIVGNTIRNFMGGNLINFNSGSVCSRISIVRNTLAAAVSSGPFNAVVFTGNVTGLAMSENTVDGSSTNDSRGVQFFKSAFGVSVIANRFANLSVAAVDMVASSGGDTFDYINVVDNTVVNCGATLKNSTANGAVVGANIFTALDKQS